MLDELLEHENITKIPPKLKQYSATFKRDKTDSLKDSYKDELRKLGNSKKISIMEKIKYRQKKEEEKKRKMLFNTLHKEKKINLHQFLSRMQNYEQRRKYNIELKKYEKLRQETSTLQDKPKINKQLKYNEKIPKEPLYKRTEEVLDEKKKVIESLSIFYTLPKEVQKQKKIMRNRYKIKNYSVEIENTKNNFDDNQGTYKKNKKEKNKKMTRQKSDEFYYKQEEWYQNKKAKEQYFEKLYQKQLNTYSDFTFHPYINQVTLEILDIKNNINTNNDDCYKYNINKSQYDDYDMNKGKTIFDKLYEDRYKVNYYNSPENIMSSISFDDNYNYTLYHLKKKNKYKNISPKYLDVYKKKKNNNLIMNKNNSFDNNINININNINPDEKKKKRNLKENRSYDDINTMKNQLKNSANSRNLKKYKPNRFNYTKSKDGKYKENKEIDNYQWKNSLLNINYAKGRTNDFTYHLNVRQRGAWDPNFLNQITFDKNANTRSIINDIISN